MKKPITLFIALILATMLSANNINVSNVKLTGQNTGSDYALVQFDISWDNSWRTSLVPYNWDAAWVFVKYRIKTANGGDGLWRHASLNSDGHTAPAGSAIDVGLLDPATAFNASTNPGLGAFVFRDAAGTGAFGKTGVQLRWNYGVNFKTGTTPIGDNDAMDVQVFAVEMVYVPGGSFKVGSGGTEAGSFTAANNTSGATVPFQITAAAPTLQGNDAGSSATNLSARGAWSWDLTGTTTATFATGYPTGFGAFYCMKYEICQQDYVDFLNNLSQAQATARYPGQTTKRHGITVASNVYSTTLPFVACNFLSWADVAGYLDWSGMRPMTELEFEKACRGTLTPVASEYAWGSVNIAASAYTLSSAGATGEVIASNYSLTAGNVANSVTVPFGGGIDGPLRVGIFAGTSGNTGRETSGATYYGIMEMSGNLYERAVTAGNATGRLFTGTHGNGALAANGDADASTWPAASDAIGAGFRGGCWGFAPEYLLVSERANAAASITARENYYGGRGVRSTFSCGSYTINHATGVVSPVTKTVTYRTVTNIPGETSKCWITSNLGADHQATSVDDATEESAGWYWQFNRKQGYKNDGINLTPAWTITSINEDLNWEPANDPCAIELGSGWRIPTSTEWTNVDASWANWDGPWNSGLKLHAAGYLNYSGGSLYDRGSDGDYWSSTQNSTTNGWYLNFRSGYSILDDYDKADGFSLRCLTGVAEFVCGSSSVTVNHVGGDGVAPVTKTVTYGTVTNIPGETSKCWITSNLGADHQATAVDDNTEPSAGWYWQFNRKQGYKNDGTTLTPAWTITSISENSDWLTANDPCAIELGSGWRIPTSTEWFNVDNIGGWTDWYGPWNSGLKLHAAGYLNYSGGSLGDRGSFGDYWSSAQYSSSNGWDMNFGSGYSYVLNHNKAYGFSLRCLRDYVRPDAHKTTGN